MAAQKVRLLTILAFLTFHSFDSFRVDVYKGASQLQVEEEHYCPPGFCLEYKAGMENEPGAEADLTGLVNCLDISKGEKVQVLSWSPYMENADELKADIDKQGLTVAKLCMASSPAVPGGSVEEEVLDEDDFGGPTSPTATGDMDTGSIDVDGSDEDKSGEVQTPESQDSPSSEAKGKKITITGFPEDIDGVHRGVLNGVYYQALGDHCVQGKPTYWRKLVYGSEEYDSLKQPDQDLPFLYFCKQNSSTQLWHRKWAISRAADFNKIKDGKCETFAPFPARKELEVGMGPTAVHLGWKDGQNLGFGEPADYAWINDIKITAVEDMDESPTIDCSAGEAPGLDVTGPPNN